MFGIESPGTFANAPGETGGRLSGAWRLLLVIGLGLIAFGFWSAQFQIEEVTRGIGRVVPSSETKQVQTLDGGLVVEVAVSEGDRVAAGDVLMVIDDTRVAAARGELLEKEMALLAEQARVEAEASGADPVFPPDLSRDAPRRRRSRAGGFRLAPRPAGDRVESAARSACAAPGGLRGNKGAGSPAWQHAVAPAR